MSTSLIVILVNMKLIRYKSSIIMTVFVFCCLNDFKISLNIEKNADCSTAKYSKADSSIQVL